MGVKQKTIIKQRSTSLKKQVIMQLFFLLTPVAIVHMLHELTRMISHPKLSKNGWKKLFPPSAMQIIAFVQKKRDEYTWFWCHTTLMKAGRRTIILDTHVLQGFMPLQFKGQCTL